MAVRVFFEFSDGSTRENVTSTHTRLEIRTQLLDAYHSGRTLIGTSPRATELFNLDHVRYILITEVDEAESQPPQPGHNQDGEPE